MLFLIILILQQQALRLTKMLITILNQEHSYSAQFMVVEYAFDLRYGTKAKMKLHYINPTLCTLIYFLRATSVRERIGTCLSGTPIYASVLQGSVLLPVLYTADIPNQTVNDPIFSYADDTIIISYSKHQNNDAQRL